MFMLTDIVFVEATYRVKCLAKYKHVLQTQTIYLNLYTLYVFSVMG